MSNLAEKLKSNLALEKKALNLQYAYEWGVDMDRRIIQITGEIEPGMFEYVDTSLTELESTGRGAITIKINSPGGSTYEALAIAGRIKACKRQVITEGYGHMMSAATLILACGDKRRMCAYAWFMHHKTSYGVEGDHDTIVDEVKHMEREEREWARIMGDLTSRSARFWLDTAHKRNVYMSADECKRNGVVDEIF